MTLPIQRPSTRIRKRAHAWPLSVLLAAVLSNSLPAQAGPTGDANSAFDPNFRGSHFDVDREFPNFFLPEQYRANPESAPPGVIRNSRQDLEKALKSVFGRLEVPIVPEGEHEVRMVRYFDYVRAHLREVDPTVEVMPSGGVVRSAISYIYNEMYQGASRRPPKNPQDTLREIIQSKEGLPGSKIRGVGSDFDVLLRCNTEKFNELEKVASRITNSAETHFEAREIKGDFKRSLFTVGDVKEYYKQVSRSTAQGGSAIDFLAYDMVRGVFVEPETHPHIIEQMIQGVYEYLPPHGEEKIEDGPKQTIRGIRALLELPFMRLKDPETLTKELIQLNKDIKEGKYPNKADLEKAFSQFDKTVRNARASGAHNRIWRGAPNTVEAAAAELARTVRTQYGRTSIPEFVDHFPIDHRTAAEPGLNGLSSSLLVPEKEFLANPKYTHNGTLYHGTKSLDNGMAIMRGGIFISDQDQGTAAWGRGGYSSPERSTALGYAGAEGVVFELKVRTDRPVHVLDWESTAVQEDPFIKKLIAEETKPGRSENQVLDAVFKRLSHEHGVDLILNGHMLIQNMAALEMPNGMKDLMNAFRSAVENPNIAPKARVSAFETYEPLYTYAKALGEKGVKSPIPEAEFRKLMLANPETRGEALVALLEGDLTGPLTRNAIKREPKLRAELNLVVESEYHKTPTLLEIYPWKKNDPALVKIAAKISDASGMEKFNRSEVTRAAFATAVAQDPDFANRMIHVVETGYQKSPNLLQIYPWKDRDPELLKLAKKIRDGDQLEKFLYTDQARKAFTEALKQDAALSSWLENHFDKPNEKSAYLFTHLPWDQMDQVTRSKFNRYLARMAQKYPRTLEYFPWNPNDPYHSELFQRLTHESLANRANVEGKLREIGLKILEHFKDHPRYSWMKHGVEKGDLWELMHFNPSEIKDPQLRREYIALRDQAAKYEHVAKAADSMGQSVSVKTDSEGNPTVNTQWSAKSQGLGEMLQRLLSRRPGSPLTASEQGQLKLLLSIRDRNVLDPLLGPRVAPEVKAGLIHLLEQDNPLAIEAAFEILKSTKTGSGSARNQLIRELDRKPEWRRRLAQAAIAETATHETYSSKWDRFRVFPWDLTRAEDLKTVREAAPRSYGYKDGVGNFDEFVKGLGSTDNYRSSEPLKAGVLAEVDLSLIATAKDRARFKKMRKESHPDRLFEDPAFAKAISAAIQKDPSAKQRIIYEAVSALNKKNQGHSAYSNLYPWDIESEADRMLLEEIRKGALVPGEKPPTPEQVGEEILKLHPELKQALKKESFFEDRDWIPWSSLNPSKVPAGELRDKLIAAQRSNEMSRIGDEVLENLFYANPMAVAAHYPDYKDSHLSYFLNVEFRNGKPVGVARRHSSYPDDDKAGREILGALAKKLAASNHPPLNEGERALLRILIANENEAFTTLALAGGEDSKKIALTIMKEASKGRPYVVLDALETKETDKVPASKLKKAASEALSEALNHDRGWWDNVKASMAQRARPIDAHILAAVPWDHSVPPVLPDHPPGAVGGEDFEDCVLD